MQRVLLDHDAEVRSRIARQLLESLEAPAAEDKKSGEQQCESCNRQRAALGRAGERKGQQPVRRDAAEEKQDACARIRLHDRGAEHEHRCRPDQCRLPAFRETVERKRRGHDARECEQVPGLVAVRKYAEAGEGIEHLRPDWHVPAGRERGQREHSEKRDPARVPARRLPA